MPVRPTYPGVYIEEVPSGVRTIVGVATSVGAFIDYFARGPMNLAIQIFSFSDFEREFGGLDLDSEASYAIQQFFLNGGSEAFVVRVGRVTAGVNTFAAASTDVQDETPANSLRLRAGRLMKGVSVDDPGTWGNFLRADVDYDTTDTANLFNLTISEVAQFGTQAVLRTETFRNLTMTPALPNVPTFVEDVVNEGSRMVQVQTLGGARPAPTGTMSDVLVPATLTAMLAPFQLNVQLTGDIPRVITLARAPAGA